MLKALPWILILIAGVGGFFYGKNIGKELEQSKQKTVVIEANDYREKIEHEGKLLTRDELIDELDTGGWLRND